MNRRMIVLALAAVAGLAATGRTAPQNPNIDDIIAKNVEARGGLERIKAVTTIRQEARLISMTMPGNETSTTMYLKRPNLTRQEISVNGQRIVSGYDGKTPWIINPLTGSSRPVLISGPQADAIREQVTFDPILVDYRSRWQLVEYVGRETESGRPMHHLKITAPSRQVSHLYLDAATMLEAKLMTEGDRTTKMEVTWDDYRDVRGLKFAFLQRRIVNGVVQDEMRFQTIETNVPISDGVFAVPKG
jgi:hypothetical protein